MDLDTARRALYRRGADDADRIEYERLSALRDDAEASVSADPVRKRPGERRLLVAVALGVAAVALAATGVSVALRPPQHAHAASAPAPLHGVLYPLRFTAQEQQRVDALFAAALRAQDSRSDQEDRLGAELVEDAQASSDDGDLPADGAPPMESGLAVGSGRLASGVTTLPAPTAQTGLVLYTLIVVRTARAVDWRGTITRRSSAGLPLPPIVLDAAPADSDAQYTKVFGLNGVTLLDVRIDVPRGVRYDLQVLEAQAS